MSACKVLFLALEAAEPELLKQWMGDGTLPNLASLRDRSLYGELPVLRGIGANAIWPSVYTGVGPAKHGRYYHDQLEAGGYQSAQDSQVGVEHGTVWDAASAAGRAVGMVDLPRAFTSEHFNGVQVIDWNTHFSAGDFHTYPAELAQGIADRFGMAPPCPCLTKRYLEPDPGEVTDTVRQLREATGRSLTLIREQLQSRDWDLFLAAFDQLHCAGHLLWHQHDGNHPWHPTPGGAGHDPLLDLYREIDTAVGILLDELPEDCRIVLFTGPGMGPSYVRPELLDRILVALEGGRASPARKLVAAAKTLWHWLPQGWRRPLSAIARRAEKKLQRQDRSGRRCFSVKSNDSVGGIRINLQGRESSGRVAPDEMDAYCEELIRAIKAIRIVDSGERLAQHIFRTNTVYQGKCLDALPDILIEWNQKSVITALASPDIGLLRQDRLPDWSGTHSQQALAMVRVPELGSGPLPADASVLDIAPTLAELCGLDALDTEGCSLLRRGESS